MSGGRQTPRHFRQALQARANSNAASSGFAARIGTTAPRCNISIARSVRLRQRLVACSVVLIAPMDADSASASVSASLPDFLVTTRPRTTHYGEQITQEANWRVGIGINHVTDSTRAALAAQRQPDVISSDSAKPFPKTGAHFGDSSPDRRATDTRAATPAIALRGCEACAGEGAPLALPQTIFALPRGASLKLASPSGGAFFRGHHAI